MSSVRAGGGLRHAGYSAGRACGGELVFVRIYGYGNAGPYVDVTVAR